MLHQISNVTEYNRYPEIFKECVKYFSHKRPKILSFGCSDGREVKTLRELYFKESLIDGVDISTDMIDKCRALNLDKQISFYHSSTFTGSHYDLIFCLSVLCRWPQTEHMDNCFYEYSFDQFEAQLLKLDSLLNPGGLLVVYNANFRFSDTNLFKKYKILHSDVLKESGFVKKFDRENNAVHEPYHYSIFIKLTLIQRIFQFLRDIFTR